MRCKSLIALWLCLLHTACQNQLDSSPRAKANDAVSPPESTVAKPDSPPAPLSRRLADRIQTETPSQNANIQGIAISPDSRFLVVLDAGDSSSGRPVGQALHIWDLKRQDSNAKTIANLASGMRLLLFSPKGNAVFTIGAGENHLAEKVYCWDTQTWNIIKIFDIEADSWNCGTVSPDGVNLFLGGGFTRGLIGVWNLSSGKNVARISHKVLQEGSEPQISGHYDTVTNVQISSDGARLFTVGRENSIRFWDARTLKELRVFEKFPSHFDRAVLAPSEKLFAMVRLSRTIDFYGCDSGQVLTTVDLSQQLKEITAVAFSPDSRFLVVGGARWDERILVVDVRSGKVTRSLTGQTHEVESLMFAPSGRLLFIAQKNSSSAHLKPLIRIFDIDEKDVFTAFDSTSSQESQPSKDVTKKSHPRDVVARKSRGSLPFLMQECGYRFGYAFGGDLERFVKGAIEPAQTGALEGRFKIATTIYRIPTSDQARNKADAFRLRSQFGNNGKPDATEKDDRIDDDEIAIQMTLPFRLYKADSAIDRERTKGVKGVGTVAVDRADTSNMWFLTKDERLEKCTPREAQLVLARGGTLYFGENRNSRLVFRGFDSNPHAQKLRNIPYNDFDPIRQTEHSVVCEIEIEQLTYGPVLVWQESWGYYRREAIQSEEGDSDFIVNWNSTGALTGMTPDYFRPTKSANPLVVSAKLVSATLRTREGEVIASYQQK